MINTLVSLDADLASSIAFRYSCRLTQLVDMNLQTIHVEEVEKEGYPPGSGWVRSTWEKGLLQTAQEEIAQLINAERPDCQPPNNTILRIGDREEELLREIEENDYDLLIEGVLNSFDSQLFHQKVRSKLYKLAHCPIVLVKNLVNPDRVALLMSDSRDAEAMVATFIKLFDKSQVQVDLVGVAMKKSSDTELKQKAQDVDDPGLQEIGKTVDAAEAQLAGHGWTPGEKWIIRDSPKRIGEMLDAYGLVAARISGDTTKRKMVMDLLSRVPSATLMCKQ